MKKFTILVATLALGGALAFAAPGDGVHGSKHGKMGMHDGFGKMAEKLNLTDAQKTQMQETHQAFRTENEALFNAMRDTREQLREARQSGNTALASTLAATAEQQRAELKVKKDALHERTLQLLTPEQRAQMEEMKAQRAERGKQRGQKRQQRQ